MLKAVRANIRAAVAEHRRRHNDSRAARAAARGVAPAGDPRVQHCATCQQALLLRRVDLLPSYLRAKYQNALVVIVNYRQ